MISKDGIPIAGARVQALEELARPDAALEESLEGMVSIEHIAGISGVASEAVSAADGSYQLGDLRVAGFTVRVVARGHSPRELKQVLAPRQEVDIVLEPGTTFGGGVHDHSGAPIGGAEIQAYRVLETENVFDSILSKARPPIDSVKTDSAGAFRFDTLGKGTYNFAIQAKGYHVTAVLKQQISSDGSTQLNIVLKPGRTIQGEVHGPDGQTVSGARVRVSATGGLAKERRDSVRLSFDDDSLLTNEEGRFDFDSLEEGSYVLLCWHPDYQTVRRADVRTSDSSILLEMTKGARLRGRVTEAGTGNVIPGARVSVSDIAELRKEGITRDDGSYTVVGLLQGKRPVNVRVSADGHVSLRRDLKIDESSEAKQDFELERTGNIRGRAVDSRGAGVAGARVMVRKANRGGVDQTLGTGTTDRDGKFSLHGIEPGDGLWIRVRKPEYLDGTSGTFSLHPSELVKMPPLVLTLGGSVQGVVLGPDGKGVSGAMVTMRSEGETELTAKAPSSSTNDRGEFSLIGLRSGSYDLHVEAPRYVAATLAGIDVIEEKCRKGIEMKLEAGRSLSGRVVDFRGQAVPGAQVAVLDLAQGAKELRAATAGDGKFMIDAIAAKDVVDLVVTHEDFATYSKAQVDVNLSGLEVVLVELGKLRGRVMTVQNAPATEFTVQAWNPSTKDARKQLKPMAFGAQDGHFEYRGLPAGTYNVNVRAPGYAATSLQGIKVSNGGCSELGDIILQDRGKVTGRVIDAASKSPLEGVRVEIVQGTDRFLPPDLETPPGGKAPSAIQATGADGNFRFSGLKSGKLALRFSHEGYVTRKVDDINPDFAEKSQDLVIELDLGGEVSGLVLGAAGKPSVDVPVYLTAKDASANQTQRTDAEGKFHFVGVPAGSFMVKAQKLGPAGGEVEEAEASVMLKPGESKVVTLKVEARSTGGTGEKEKALSPQGTEQPRPAKPTR